MNTNDLIKTAQYLDKLGSFKIADKVENKLVRLAQAGKLIVDSKIRREYDHIKKLLADVKAGKADPYGYHTSNFYPSSETPYITGHYNVKPTVEELNKRLKFITSTEFIKGFNLLRANHLVDNIAPNARSENKRQDALNKAKELRENANSGATSPFLPSVPSKGSGKSSGSSGKPSGSSKPSGSAKLQAKKPGKATVTIIPTSNITGATSSSGPASATVVPPAASSSTTLSTPPASPQEGKNSLMSLLDELDAITADENVWKANVNKVIPKLRKANSLFTSIYESLTPQEARLLGNRIDMITLANTTFTGRFSGMR